MNPISMATKEMGPAMRHEVLDDHWSSWNWTKIQNMGKFKYMKFINSANSCILGINMSKSLHYAIQMQQKHKKIFEEHNATFPLSLTSSWKAHIEKWNQDHTVKPDPYEDIEICMSLLHYLICQD